MTKHADNLDNDVNDARQNSLLDVASGSGGSRASSVVNTRNPCSGKMRIGTWNVRTMLRPGKLINVIREMKKANLNVLGLSEVRWKDGGDFCSEGVRVIYSGGSESQRGVAIMLTEELGKCVKCIERIDDRILKVTIDSHPVDMVIIQIYMPTSAHDEEEIDGVYDRIEGILEKTKGTDYTILMGDWNASVGEGRELNIVGKYGLGKRNEGGEKLVEFCRRQKLMVANTWFAHEKRRRYTWKMPGDGDRYQLDYILVNVRYRNSVKNAHALPGADADTDHNMVAMTTRTKLKFIKPRRKKMQKWDREKMKTKGKELANGIEGRMTQHMEGTTEDIWKQWKTIVLAETEKIIGYKTGARARKPWITEEMIQDMEERRKWKHQSSVEANQAYKRLNNKLRKTTDKAREAWWRQQCEDIEVMQRSGRYDQVYDKIRRLSKKNRESRGIEIRDKEGTLLHDKKVIQERWMEYIEELYDKGNRPTELEIGETIKEDVGPEIIREEVIAAIADMKNNKSEGIDRIPAEILKLLEEKGLDSLIKLCQKIYVTGEWPTDFVQSILIPMKKKANATECGDHRTISLISHAAKIVLKILNKRIQAKVESIKYLGEDQFGFRKGMGTRDAILVLRVMNERSIQHGLDVYICFVDYEKAFDRVVWQKLLSTLIRLGVDERDKRLISNLYLNQEVMIRIEGEDSEPGKIGRGVRQGCPLSPLLFNIYIEELVKEAMEKINDGVKVGGKLVKALRFADDQAMVASSQGGLQRMMNALTEVSLDYGMKINTKKTKVMRISRMGRVNVKIQVDGKEVEQVEEFCYLGSVITADARCQMEVRRRIALGKEAFKRRKELMRGGLSKELKKRMVKTLIWSVVLYASETWTLRKEDIQRLEAFEMWIWRRMMGISWTERKTNEEVLRMVEEERSLIETIRQRQHRWIGHILRRNTLLGDIIEGRLEGKKTRGRPRKMILDWMMTKGYRDLKNKVQNREEWRQWRFEPAQ